MKKKKNKLDPFHYHEALDRTYLIEGMINSYLYDHPVIQKHEEVKKNVEEAQRLLVETYQILGGLSITQFENETKNNKSEDSVKGS